MRNMTIYIDLDGTVYDLYGVPNWLSLLRNEIYGAYTDGESFLKAETFYWAELLKKAGVKFEVITWLSMGASKKFEKSTTLEKECWVSKNLPFVSRFTAQSYGKPKHTAIRVPSKTEILIDDNTEVCENWRNTKRIAINVNKDFDFTSALKLIYEKYFAGV